MAIGLCSNIGFTSDTTTQKPEPQASVNTSKVQQPVAEQPKEDSFKLQNNPQSAQEPQTNATNLNQQKKSTLKNKIASIAKFFTATEEITKGTAKGAIYGTLTGGLIMAGGWLFGALPRGFQKGNSLIKIFKHPYQAISSKTKITAGITAIGIAVYHIIRGNMQANLHKAFIDKKLNND